MPCLVAIADPFVYPGLAVVARLLSAGHRVRALCPSPPRVPDLLSPAVDVRPFSLDATAIAADLAGVDAVVWSSWGLGTWSRAVVATSFCRAERLVQAAVSARVSRFVWTTVTHVEEEPRLRHFLYQSVLERAVVDSGVPYALLRPAGFFGPGSTFVSQLASAVRSLPVVPVPWEGRRYWFRPVHVHEYADAVVHALGSPRSSVRDVVGPERLEFMVLLLLLARLLGARASFVRCPPDLCARLWRVLSSVVPVPLVGRDELVALARNRLDSPAASLGRLRLTDWLHACGDGLGRRLLPPAC